MSIGRKRQGLSIKPFTGTEEEAERNYLTHQWEEVPNPLKSMTKTTGLFAITAPIPDTTFKCSRCNEWDFSEARRYPCGQAERD
jgi:hypothetical protein